MAVGRRQAITEFSCMKQLLHSRLGGAHLALRARMHHGRRNLRANDFLKKALLAK